MRVAGLRYLLLRTHEWNDEVFNDPRLAAPAVQG